MAFQITANPRSSGRASIAANTRARGNSILTVDWGHVTDKPALVDGFDDLTATGIVVLTDLSGGATTRTVTGTANEITVTNGSGVSGNPTLSLPTALTFTSKTITGGTYIDPLIARIYGGSAVGSTLTLQATSNGAPSGEAVNVVAHTISLAGAAGSTTTVNIGAAGSSNGVATLAGASSGSTSLIASAAASGTITLPAATDTLVGLATTDALTNKTYNKVTITAPATSATLTIPDGVTLTGPASSGTAMTLGNTETVTGVKTFGSAGAVGRLKIAGTTSGTTVLDATAVASGTLTLPAATDTLVGKATTDELTNKTLTTSVGKGTWTASGTWTLPAITLGGTVSGGGNQLNNIIIGTSTPLAGSFTSITATSATLNTGAFTATKIGQWGASGNYSMISLNNDLTGAGGIGIVGGASGDSNIYFCVSTGGAFTFRLNNSNLFQINNSQFTPVVDNTIALGTSSFQWSDLRSITATFTGAVTGTSSIKSTSATAGMGYGTGAGGTITQITSRTTGVTLDKVCGAITLFAAAPAVGTWVSFTVTNSTVAATDVPKVAVKSGTNTYIAHVTAVAAGSFQISFTSIVGTASDSPVISFTVEKAVTS